MHANSHTPGAGRGVLLLWVLGFVLHRALVLELGFDGIFFWEESFRLLMAEALWEGWGLGVADLQADPYAGGSLVIAALVAPLIPLGLATLTGLKWVALVWAAAGLVLWWSVMDRYFGRPAAHLFALCYVAAPPLFVTYNLIAMGSHAETVTLSAAQFLLMLRYVEAPERRGRTLLGWMALAGLSIWFTYVSALTFLVCLAYALFSGALPPRRWAEALAAFAVGLLPWFAYNLNAGWAGLQVLDRAFGAGSGLDKGTLVTLARLGSGGLPLALRFDAAALAWVYYIAFIAAWLLVALRCWRRLTAAGSPRLRVSRCPESPLLALFPVLVVVIAMSNHDFNPWGVVPFLSFRIFVPAMPLMFFVLAVAAAGLNSRGRAAGAVVIVLLGAVTTMQLTTSGHQGKGDAEVRARATGAEAMGHLLVYRQGANMAYINTRAAAVEETLRPAVYRGVGFGLAYLRGSSDEHEPESIIGDVMAAPERYRANLKAGIATALGPGLAQVRPLPASPRTKRMATALAKADLGR